MMSRRCISLVPGISSGLKAFRTPAASAGQARFALGAMVMQQRTFRSGMPVRKEFTPEEIAQGRAEAENHPFYAAFSGKIPQKIKDIGDQCLALNMIETEELKKYMMERLGIDPNQLMMNNGGMNMGGGGGGGGGGAAPAAAEAAPVEVKKEKTEFAVKLESFAAADKLKVIKEIRAITGLGLKESKEMVEGAPAVVKSGVSKEDAEKFKAAIEAAGGKVVLE